jgi:hypothetical protein
VDALVDAAVMGQPVLAAVRDGGQVAAVRPFRGQAERSITDTLVLWPTTCTPRTSWPSWPVRQPAAESRYGWQQNSPLSAHPKRTA